MNTSSQPPPQKKYCLIWECMSTRHRTSRPDKKHRRLCHWVVQNELRTKAYPAMPHRHLLGFALLQRFEGKSHPPVTMEDFLQLQSNPLFALFQPDTSGPQAMQVCVVHPGCGAWEIGTGECGLGAPDVARIVWRFSRLARPSSCRGRLKRSARAVQAQCNYLGV